MKKQLLILLLVGFSVLSIVKTAFASPVINEFYSAESSDWIEIYNPENEVIDLAAYRIRDSSENNKIDLSGSLAAKGFVSIEWSNKLNNVGDLIKLVLTSDNSVIDQVSYGDQGGISSPESGQSAGRKIDGGTEWVLFVTHSKGSSNNSISVFTPPTPTFTKAPMPTKTPSPTKAPTSTKTPTTSKTSTAVLKSPTSINSSAAIAVQKNSGVKSAKISHGVRSASEFAVIKSVTDTEGKQEDVKVLGAKDEKTYSLILISGILFLASGIFIFVRKFLKERNIL